MAGFLIVSFFLIACGGVDSGRPEQAAVAADHAGWTALLKENVDRDGLVNYRGMIRDSSALNRYLEDLSAGAPPEGASREVQLAYWINAYNAFTVKLIIDNYPLESIRDLNPTLSVPTIRSIWTKKWFTIGGEAMSLDNIEHDILRKNFNEPRIHFAINCASISCPKLRAEAFTAANLDRQLDEQATDFINDPLRNDIRDPSNPRLSRIFDWFTGDFTREGTLAGYINRYATAPITGKITYMSYDWRLNEAK